MKYIYMEYENHLKISVRFEEFISEFPQFNLLKGKWNHFTNMIYNVTWNYITGTIQWMINDKGEAKNLLNFCFAQIDDVSCQLSY